tara:strand:- start:480 stop:896 length:417 start_codon:yes stop_codon:yes gene_type:complete
VKKNCAKFKPCPHGKLKSQCAVCSPCPHGKVKKKCAVCNGCPYGKLKYNCAVCSACPHGKVKHHCAECKTARAAPPSAKRVKREQESSPEIMQEPDIKEEPEPFTIQGYFGFDKQRPVRCLFRYFKSTLTTFKSTFAD